MLVIRLFRVGKKNQPFFKIVVTDKRKPPRAGRFVEEVGFYNPRSKEKVLKTERIKYWLSVGAIPSDTVHNLLVSEKIIEGKKIPVHKKAKKEKEAVPEKPAKEKPAEKAAEKPAEKPKEKEKPKEEKPKPSSAPASAEATAGKKAAAGKEEKKEEKPEKE